MYIEIEFINIYKALILLVLTPLDLLSCVLGRNSQSKNLNFQDESRKNLHDICQKIKCCG